MKNLVFLFLISSLNAQAKKLCEYYEWMSCPDAFGAARSTTGASLPNNTAAASINPSTISVDRGLGAETLIYKGDYDVSLVGGTGAIGSAFAVGSQEGNFFGATPIQDYAEYLNRKIDGQKYESKKLSGMLAFNLWRNRKKNASFKVNLGVIGKYNQDTKKTGGGLGLSLKIKNFSMGVARHKDDHKSTAYVGAGEFYTNTVSLGFQFSSLAVDWTYMKNNMFTPNRVRLLTATMFLKKFMLTYGLRDEEGIYPYYDRDLKILNPQKENGEAFLGVQYSAHKNLIFGLFSNYYLVDDMTLGVSFFF